jgi:aminoglycoside N3'-acetyltransferase
LIANHLKNIGKKIPSDSKIVVYVKLKGLIDDMSDYETKARSLLNMIRDLLRPSEIYVPTFTYGFTKKNFFKVINTPSEVGRFSEEIRNIFNSKRYRTLDPIFSVVETEKGSFGSKIFNDNAFGPSSIWEQLNHKPHYIVNINLNSPITSTELHHLEYKIKVPYRYTKNIKGEVVGWDNIKHEFDYRYYVRDLELNPEWSRDKLLIACQNHNLVIESGPIKLFEWTNLCNFLQNKLSYDINYLINNEM